MDKFEKALEEKTKELKECQKSKNLDSCLKCEKVLECTIRDEYVKAAFDSMSKGQSGGFEF
ncbi:hypothetical protein ACKGJI_03795 [Sulfurospirillum sp. 1307]|jgi:hypothetical protein